MMSLRTGDIVTFSDHSWTYMYTVSQETDYPYVLVMHLGVYLFIQRGSDTTIQRTEPRQRLALSIWWYLYQLIKEVEFGTGTVIPIPEFIGLSHGCTP